MVDCDWISQFNMLEEAQTRYLNVIPSIPASVVDTEMLRKAGTTLKSSTCTLEPILVSFFLILFTYVLFFSLVFMVYTCSVLLLACQSTALTCMKGDTQIKFDCKKTDSFKEEQKH